MFVIKASDSCSFPNLPNLTYPTTIVIILCWRQALKLGFRAQSTAFGRNGAEVELKNEQFVMACLRFGRDGNSKTFRSFSDLNWVTSVFQIVCYDLLGPFCGAEVRLT